MILSDKYQFAKLEQINSPNGRRYQVPDGSKLPSVTTILDKTADKSGLDIWRERVGDEKADRIIHEAVTAGELMHSFLEDELLGREPQNKRKTLHHIYADRMAHAITENAFHRISEVYGVEAQLYYPNLYAGTTDLVGVLDGIPTIMDFKNAKKIKKKEYIIDYYLQGCSYAHAFNYLYGTNINRVAIFMATRPNDKCLVPEYGEFIIEGEEFEKYSKMWIERVEDYYANYHDK